MPRALVAAGVVLGLVVLPGAGRARAQQAAPVDASLAVVGYAGASLVTDDRPARIAVAASFALGLGIAKEVWDATGHGDASWRDLTWDVVGTTTGVLIACAIDWAIGRLRGPTKASTTTSTTAPVKSPVTDP
jgi:uncharacterized protein YfiM (DUF2279 family)